MLSKLPSYDFFHDLYSFLSSLISGRSLALVVDDHCSTLKPITSGVPKRSVLSPILFLLFINDLLSLTNCPIHSFADDYTLSFFFLPLFLSIFLLPQSETIERSEVKHSAASVPDIGSSC